MRFYCTSTDPIGGLNCEILYCTLTGPIGGVNCEVLLYIHMYVHYMRTTRMYCRYVEYHSHGSLHPLQAVGTSSRKSSSLLSAST